ncbi:hypothetical protein [Mesorhizobium sp. M0166]
MRALRVVEIERLKAWCGPPALAASDKEVVTGVGSLFRIFIWRQD